MCLKRMMPHKRLHAQSQKTETADGSVKHVQSKQQRHQNDVIDIVVVSSSPTLNISYTPHQCRHFRS